MKSKNWVNRQKNDQFVKKAKQLGYINRAAFKLEEIEQKYKIIEHSREILELGSSPGGWSQVILNYNPKSKSFFALESFSFLSSSEIVIISAF